MFSSSNSEPGNAPDSTQDFRENPQAARPQLVRSRSDPWKKAAALLLVLVSLTAGMIGLGLVSAGKWWAIALILVTPIGITLATKIVPEKGSSGYCDQNL